MDLNPIISAIALHQWELLGGLLLGASIATIKQGWLGLRVQKLLPPRFIPLLAPTYTVLGVFAVDLVAQRSSGQVLSDMGAAAVSAFTAIVLHQGIVEMGRDGKEIIPKKPKPLPSEVVTKPEIVPLVPSRPPPPPKNAA